MLLVWVSMVFEMASTMSAVFEMVDSSFDVSVKRFCVMAPVFCSAALVVSVKSVMFSEIMRSISRVLVSIAPVEVLRFSVMDLSEFSCDCIDATVEATLAVRSL